MMPTTYYRIEVNAQSLGGWRAIGGPFCELEQAKIVADEVGKRLGDKDHRDWKAVRVITEWYSHTLDLPYTSPLD
jgi:hypothetical protein